MQIGPVGAPYGRKVIRRRGPPHPLGEDARIFPYGAATTRDTTGAGLLVRIDRASEAESYQSGDAITGTVTLGRLPAGLHPGAQGQITIRLYFEARTLFHDDERVFNNATRLSSTGKRMKRYPMGHEWHRGIASHVTIPLDTSSLASSSPAYSLPFELRIPTSMTITESSQYVNARGIKTPPRGSCDVPRSPPPTLRNHRNASVEWVVEAIVRFDSASAPEYSRTGEATVARADERGFLNSRPPDFLVARSVFPFVPRDRDLAPLYDFGDGTAAIPGFAPDPTKRTEAQGAMLVHDGRPAPPRSAKAVEAGAIERPSVVWSKTVQLQGTLGMSGGSIVVRTSIPNGARFERDQARLNMQLRCVFAVKKGLSFKLGGGKGKGKAEEKLQRISVVIMRRVYTRGGAEEEGHVKFEEVRRCEHVFPSTSQDLSVSKREEQADGQDVTVYDLSVDMQSSTARTPTSFQVPSVQLVPSFRLPNIELDYIVTINVVPVGDEFFCAARFPLQLLTGRNTRSAVESEPPPAFDWDELGHIVVAEDGELPGYSEP